MGLNGKKIKGGLLPGRKKEETVHFWEENRFSVCRGTGKRGMVRKEKKKRSSSRLGKKGKTVDYPLNEE